MDASPLFDPKYLPIIVATLVGFGTIAALLLVPVYRFLEREEQVAQKWTPEELAERFKEARAAREEGQQKEAQQAAEEAEDEATEPAEPEKQPTEPE